MTGSNRRPPGCKPGALPAELTAPKRTQLYHVKKESVNWFAHPFEAYYYIFMLPVLTKTQIREYENKLIRTGEISSSILMELAGSKCAEKLLYHYPECKDVLIVCGTGNNGGDGLVIARWLAEKRIRVSVLILESSHNSGSAEFTHNLNRIKSSNIQIATLPSDTILSRELLHNAEIIIDAILGTGFSGNLSPSKEEAIKLINSTKCPVISLDIPSGLDADNSQHTSTHINADRTYAIGALKPCHTLFPAIEACGKISFIDIGIASQKSAQTLWTKCPLTIPPPRKQDSHKYNYGHIGIIGGSSGMEGALNLATHACLTSGSGLVTAICPSTIYDKICPDLPGTMTQQVEANPDGTFSDIATTQIIRLLNSRKFTALAVGPGMRQSQAGQLLILALLAYNLPLIIDADGLNNLSTIDTDPLMSTLAKRTQPLILTPHHREAARLLSVDTATIDANPIESAKLISAKYSATVVLKGYPTVISSPNEQSLIIPAGNPGMAKAGSGDTLTGILAATLCRLPAIDASAYSVILHGICGDLANKYLGEDAMQAHDLPRFTSIAREKMSATIARTSHTFHDEL